MTLILNFVFVPSFVPLLIFVIPFLVSYRSLSCHLQKPLLFNLPSSLLVLLYLWLLHFVTSLLLAVRFFPLLHSGLSLPHRALSVLSDCPDRPSTSSEVQTVGRPGGVPPFLPSPSPSTPRVCYPGRSMPLPPPSPRPAFLSVVLPPQGPPGRPRSAGRPSRRRRRMAEPEERRVVGPAGPGSTPCSSRRSGPETETEAGPSPAPPSSSPRSTPASRPRRVPKRPPSTQAREFERVPGDGSGGGGGGGGGRSGLRCGPGPLQSAGAARPSPGPEQCTECSQPGPGASANRPAASSAPKRQQLPGDRPPRDQ